MAAGIIEPSGKAAGATTKGATAGSGIAGAVAVVVAYVLVKTGVETDPVVAATLGAAVATLFSAVGAHLGGKNSPTDQARLAWGTLPGADVVTPPAGAPGLTDEPAEDDELDDLDVVVPDGTGSHRAADPIAELNAEVEALPGSARN